MGFINGTYNRTNFVASAPLLEQWDRYDIYQPIRSSLLTREILSEVKDAFVIIAREESHRGIPSSSVKSEKPQVFALKGHTVDRCFEISSYPPGFEINPNLKPNNNFNNNKSNNVDAKGGSEGNNDLKTTSALYFTNEHVMKLMSLLNEKTCSSSQANMLTVGHSNETLAKITHVGILKLNNDVVLFDVLVVPEYCVSLLSVHKLIKDIKLNVGFDETKCIGYQQKDKKQGKNQTKSSMRLKRKAKAEDILQTGPNNNKKNRPKKEAQIKDLTTVSLHTRKYHIVSPQAVTSLVPTVTPPKMCRSGNMSGGVTS
ncbi:hypothetical protein Tco_0706427 [Tanacetum coccineum]|uniref:Uncharacterized protein n=1 Tax=Tanacetum coccineum TaxID=301880 RepID=A0ABQ4Y7E6_9ASTR